MVSRMAGRHVQIMTAIAALGAGAAAWAADPPPEVMDTGVSDRHAVSTQLRVMPVDLSPHGFERTYRVPGRNDLLMRSNGAVYAVFDNMEYERDKRFKYQKVFKAVIPAATIFYIGRPDWAVIPSTGIRAVDMRHEAPPPPLRESSALDDYHGVGHVKEERVGPTLEMGPNQRVNLRVEGEHPKDARTVSEDISYPVSRPRIKPATDSKAGDDANATPGALGTPGTPGAAGATAATASSTKPAGRTERPNLGNRIDDLMGRASKDS